MGLIKAAAGAIGGTLTDQWKDYFYCDAIDADVLVVKGQKRVSGRSSNSKGESNIISDGSGIAVADGQCMMIVEQGRVVELCAEPGVFTYDSKATPSIFAGDLKKNLKGAAKDAWDRFKFGGGAGRDQRIYYFNTKEIVGNKYGTVNPIPFRVVDSNVGLDIDISIRCNGEYSYRIVNPMLFYTNVCGNVDENYEKSKIDSQLKTELLTALQPAFAKISEMGIRYSAIPGHTAELGEALNDALSQKWAELRGLQVVSFGVNTVKASEEDERIIKQLQKAAVMKDPTMAAATLVEAQASAMEAAASNEGGAMMGFMGLGMANQAGGGMNPQNLYAMGQQGQPEQPKQPAVSPDAWKCQCGNMAEGKFCTECGSPRPADKMGWTCSCGALNKGKFCSECGAAKPAGAKLYKCDKCGWEPEDPEKPPKFCPECGDIFDDKDVK